MQLLMYDTSHADEHVLCTSESSGVLHLAVGGGNPGLLREHQQVNGKSNTAAVLQADFFDDMI